VLSLVFVVIYADMTFDKSKTKTLTALSLVTKLPNLSLSSSQWESRFYDDFKTELFPELKEIDYLRFTYEK
jgi:hypothetical protein